MARPIRRVHAEPGVVKELQCRSRSATIGVRDCKRADIVLLRPDGVGVEDVAEQLKTTQKRVSVWSRQFDVAGLDGLADKPGRGRTTSIPAAKVARVVTETTRPPKGKCRWSIRQLGLPLAPKRPSTMPHDYVRHGTVTLFAALSQMAGSLIARTKANHTHVEWLRFLKQIDRKTPRGFDPRLIADDYATHKHPQVRAWLEKHPRFKMHLTPTSSSWLNLVERFFADLTGDVIRAGSFTSVNNLVRDIKAYLAERNADQKPYV